VKLTLKGDINKLHFGIARTMDDISEVVIKLNLAKTCERANELKKQKREKKVQCNEIMKKYGHLSKKRVFC
jgi:hypothetical protein